MAKRFVVSLVCMVLLLTAFPTTAFAGRSGGRSSSESRSSGGVMGAIESVISAPQNIANSLASASDSMSQIIQKLGIVVLILLVGFIAFLVVTAFGIKGISRVKNNPAALQRLEMMHAHQEKMAQIKTMTHFD